MRSPKPWKMSSPVKSCTVSLPWGVETMVLVVLIGAAGRCVEATRAMTDTTRTIVTRSARVPRG